MPRAQFDVIQAEVSLLGDASEEQSRRSRVTRLTPTQLHKPRDDDDDEGSHLGIGENVLHAGPPFHVGRVNEGQ